MSTDCTCFRKSSARKKKSERKKSRTSFILHSFPEKIMLCLYVQVPTAKKIRQVQMQDTALGPFPYSRAMRQHNIFAFPFLPSLSYQTGAVARKQVQCTELTAANIMLKNPLFFAASHSTKQKTKKRILKFFYKGSSREFKNRKLETSEKNLPPPDAILQSLEKTRIAMPKFP